LQPPNASTTSNTNCPTGETTCGTTSTSPTLYDLSHLKASNFAVTVGSATLNLLLTDANTQILQDPRIRATDGQKAEMKIGSKIPIATGSYQTGAATALVSSLVNTQFQYEDVGVDMEMTPSVHYDHDVTLKVKITVSAQSGSVTISGVTEPILSQRVIDQVIRLKEGEASILGGIQDNQDQQSWTGIPGLSSIPILKYVFGSKDHTIQTDEIVFVVVPHIVRAQDLNEQNLRAIDTGSGQSIDLRHVDNTQPPATAPAVRPAVLDQPGRAALDTVPAQSAETAAPQALAQMRAAQQPQFNPPPFNPPPATAPPAAASTSPSAQVIPQSGSSPGNASPSPPGGPPVQQAAFSFNAPTGPVAAGTSFQVPIVLNGGTDVASVPLILHYDQNRLDLTNVATGTFLNGDGQAAALIHRDDGQGNVTIVASRPPGAAGVSGGGVICVVTFQAKSAGQSALTMTRSAIVNSKQQQLPAQGASADIVIK
jgi:general secretion pathway protein D